MNGYEQVDNHGTPSSSAFGSEDSFATAHSQFALSDSDLGAEEGDVISMRGGGSNKGGGYKAMDVSTSLENKDNQRQRRTALVALLIAAVCLGLALTSESGRDRFQKLLGVSAGVDDGMPELLDEGDEFVKVDTANGSLGSFGVDDDENDDVYGGTRHHGKNDNEKKQDERSSDDDNDDDDDFPSLDDLLDGDSIRPGADVSWVLNFSIAGFAKSGTTFLMNYLRRHNQETVIHKGEVHNLRSEHGPADVVRMFYEAHREDYELRREWERLEQAQSEKQQQLLGKKKKKKKNQNKNKKKDEPPLKLVYGIKSPTELETHLTLHNYATYFPKTDFVISLRHPVKWFESFFNFRQYHHYPHMLPRPTSVLVGECEPGWPYKPECMTSCPSGKMDVCTVRANFHWALSRLGKTPMTSHKEKQLLGHHNMSIDPSGSGSKVFLMENRQIIYGHPASANFTVDLKHFLGLRQDLPALEPYIPPADKYAEFTNKEAVEHLIHICDEEHDAVREELVKIGRDASRWIVDYFMQSPEVVVTAREELVKLLEDWGRDPCDDAASHRDDEVDDDDDDDESDEDYDGRQRRHLSSWELPN